MARSPGLQLLYTNSLDIQDLHRHQLHRRLQWRQEEEGLDIRVRHRHLLLRLVLVDMVDIINIINILVLKKAQDNRRIL